MGVATGLGLGLDSRCERLGTAACVSTAPTRRVSSSAAPLGWAADPSLVSTSVPPRPKKLNRTMECVDGDIARAKAKFSMDAGVDGTHLGVASGMEPM